MSNSANPYLINLLYQSPSLLVYMGGLILAVVFWRRQPRAAGLAMIATILLLVTSVAQSVGTQWLMYARSGDGRQLGPMLWQISLIGGIVRAIATACLIAAVFVDRGAAQRPNEY
jgi:hypothetical protein